jgi:N-formylglutamate amidohydrolase
MLSETSEPPFEVIQPAADAAPVVFNSPHSGARYPAPFLAATRLDALTLRRSEDAFVDELFLPAVRLGAPLMRAHFPRAFLDVNREPYELDPRMFDGRLPADANTRSLRVAGGLGTIARVVGEAQEIYAGRLPVGEALDRIEGLYKPYHARLRGVLDEMRGRFGSVLLVDCHSMPSTGLPKDEHRRADIVLGDRYGTSCAPFITDRAERMLRDSGLAVLRNRPYAGGYITEHYGNPAAGIHALQIEINRGLYMDEATHAKSAGFTVLAATFEAFLGPFIAFVDGALGPLRWAAE